MKTERIELLEQTCKKRGIESMTTHFMVDYHSSALGRFANLPHWEKLARAMAYAIENQDVFAYADDRIGGRIYYSREAKPEKYCPELNCDTEARREFMELYPEAEELWRHQLIGTSAKGHITWFFDKILTHGTEGFKKKFDDALKHAKDEKAAEFYQGVIIMLDALQAFNDKHIEAY